MVLLNKENKKDILSVLQKKSGSSVSDVTEMEQIFGGLDTEILSLKAWMRCGNR